MLDGEEQQTRDRLFMGELGKEAPEVKFPARWYDRLNEHSDPTDSILGSARKSSHGYTDMMQKRRQTRL